MAQRLKRLPAMRETQISGLGRSPGEGNGNPIQYSCLENHMDRGACWATVHGVAKSQTQLRDFTSCHFKVSPVVCVSFLFMLSFCLLVCFSSDGQGWGSGNPVCWWLGLYFCFVCCLDEASSTGCYWWLGDAESCITVVYFVWVLTIWDPLGLVLNVTPL